MQFAMNFLAALLVILSAGASLAQDVCPLCGQSPANQLPIGPKTQEPSATFRFDTCCPINENNQRNCVLDPLGEAERVTGFSEPILNPDEQRVASLTMFNFAFEEHSSESCCVTCSCAGDPNCISFRRQQATWVVCDARTVPDSKVRRKNGFCKITEEQCAKEIDPSTGDACVWLPEPGKENKWDVKKDGSPCQPANLVPMVMYEADRYKLTVRQGDRGFIKEAVLSMEGKTYELDAERCNRWTGGTPPSAQMNKEMGAGPGERDTIWEVRDSETGIGATFRCTTLVNTDIKYMNVETTEPQKRYKQERSPVGGYCATGVFSENSNPSANSQRIFQNGFCHNNLPLQDFVIARLLCDDPKITKPGVEPCIAKFCSNFGTPGFESAEECEDAMNDDLKEGFCTTFNSDPMEKDQCIFTIETQGWEDAVPRYMNRAQPTEDCIDEFDQLPKDLDKCENGVRLQYFDEEDEEWITFRAISESKPVCRDALFDDLTVDKYPELFYNKIRWSQSREVSDCLKDQCDPQAGFAVEMIYAEEFQPLCPEANRVPLNLEDATVKFNNLGDAGPTPGECPFIYYEKVMKIGGTDIDLVIRVTAGGKYQPSNLNPLADDGVSNNGLYGELGQINVKCNSEVPLEFVFVKHDCAKELDSFCNIATDKSCDVVPSEETGEGTGLILTTYDLDHHKNRRNRETVEYCNVDAALKVPNSKVRIREGVNGAVCTNATRFVAMDFGTESDNPLIQNVDRLNRDQQQKLGQMRLKPELARIVANYKVAGPDDPRNKPRCGRRILFSADYCVR